ncbi:hypothetical protein Vretimale_5518 [Volvox reticuliferus]|uniref:Membrane insertase YidC/Oxa/ALB C-terminal domain-containing protein n=1 Tax=Volvox reticuliferus TaxID=1737510 RepID=A0A8J4G5R3_9CHLO|nr:hypothetical protein Vretifemale_5518 [Volvox reticuliferus]GIM00520.1 hypothetical protein Vretimale_5518 [Volvox reticuliferus]
MWGLHKRCSLAALRSRQSLICPRHGSTRRISVISPFPGRTLSANCQAAPELRASIAAVHADAPAVLDCAKQQLSVLYQLADASAISAASSAAALPSTVSPSVSVQRAGGWVAPLADALEQVLYFLRDGLDQLHVPHSYGYSIILLTLIVKVVTFPLTKQQVESALAVQALKPRVDLIKDRFGDDKDKVQKETSVLYEQAGVNPLAGCLPTMATIPIFIGLYSSLTNVANEGLLDTQGFYWIPSLAGPTTLAQRQSGLGTSWLFPFVDGAPPIGWDAAAAYLTLPVLLVLVQYASSYLTTPPIDPKDENANTQRALLVGLPLMIGWFALNVPSGLSLYYLSNTALSAAQQIYLKKLGGAKVSINELGPVTKPGSGRRSGVPASHLKLWAPSITTTTAETAKAHAEPEGLTASQKAEDVEAYEWSEPSFNAAEAPRDTAQGLLDLSVVNRRCKRRRLSSLVQDGSDGVQLMVAANANTSA